MFFNLFPYIDGFLQLLTFLKKKNRNYNNDMDLRCIVSLFTLKETLIKGLMT